MTNPNEATLKLNKANAALLRRALFNWRANLYFVFVTLIWMSILAAHIYLRVPLGGKDITHSKWCCAYLILPALLAVILGMVRVCKYQALDNNVLKTIAKVYTETKGSTICVTKAAEELEDSANTQIDLLFGVLSTLSIACIVVAGYLDRATDQSSIKGLSIAECVLLAGIITTLVALAFTYYVHWTASGISKMSSIKIKNISKEVNAMQEVNTTQLNSGRAQTA